MHRLVLPLLCAATAGIAAQIPAQQPAPRAPALDRLTMLVGRFEGEVRIDRPTGDPIVGPMTFSAQWDLDSAWVVARYTQTLMNRTTSGILMYTWDARSQRYLFYGFPNTPMHPNRLTGVLRGSVLEFEGDSTMGALAGMRETWELVGRDTLVTELSAMRDGTRMLGPRAVLLRGSR